jgi:hypothetical protein
MTINVATVGITIGPRSSINGSGNILKPFSTAFDDAKFRAINASIIEIK